MSISQISSPYSSQFSDSFSAPCSDQVSDLSSDHFPDLCSDQVSDPSSDQVANRDEIQISYIQTRPGSYENLGRLLEIQPKSLSSTGKIDYLAALEKQYSWLYSLIQEATLAIAGSEPNEMSNMWEGVDEAEREDVATALRLSPNTAQLRIDVARTLSNHLPATCDALSSGVISSSHATTIARETSDALVHGVSPDILPLIEKKALAHAEYHTAAQVARKLKTLFAQFAPEIHEARHEQARDSRSVNIYPEGDGMSTLIALLPSEDAQTVYLAINARIALDDEGNKSGFSDSRQPQPEDSNQSEPSDSNSPHSKSKISDERTMDMKRADALTRIATDFLGKNHEKLEKHKRPISMNVTIDLPTLLGLSNNPGLLEGLGPIPASVARKLAADGKWRKFITDPLSGNLLDMGRTHYVPSQYLVDFLTARDRICRFPGCSQPARLGDIDHAKSWDEGGETNPKNLGFLCRRHHRLKTHGDWKLVSHEDGSCTWTSPHGKEIFVPARPLNEST